MADLKNGDRVWMNGKWVRWQDATVHFSVHALHYGLGVFEGIRCYRTSDGRSAIFRLHDHIRRLFDSARICMLEIPYTQEEIAQACIEVARTSGLDSCYIRPIAFMGEGAMGLAARNQVHTVIGCWQWGAYLGDEGIKKGIRAKVSSFTRMHVNASMVKGKITGQYVNSILAKRDVVRGGYDEAILLDAQGMVAEASGENIFCVRDGIIRTPAAAQSPVLAGITRDCLMRIAADKGLEALERTFTRDFLYISDEVFLCGTAAEVTPVREIDDRMVGTGKPGPVTTTLQEAFFRATRGEEPRYGEWLTYL